MYGEVTVPYTGIGGQNMDSGIMPADIGGSTNPGLDEGQQPEAINIKWLFPGGIVGRAPNGVGWGYMLTPGVECRDDDIKNWLLGNVQSGRGVNPTRFYTEDEVTAAIDPGIEDDIAKLMAAYVRSLLGNDDYNLFRETYNVNGCMVFG